MGHHDHEHGAGNRRALAIVLALTAGFTVVEIIGGLLTGSLALLADAGHMLSDNLSLGLALFAAWLAQRPRSGSSSKPTRDSKIRPRSSAHRCCSWPCSGSSSTPPAP
jgi:Co/Zn/Cd efflux system component